MRFERTIGHDLSETFGSTAGKHLTKRSAMRGWSCRKTSADMTAVGVALGIGRDVGKTQLPTIGPL